MKGKENARGISNLLSLSLSNKSTVVSKWVPSDLECEGPRTITKYRNLYSPMEELLYLSGLLTLMRENKHLGHRVTAAMIENQEYLPQQFF